MQNQTVPPSESAVIEVPPPSQNRYRRHDGTEPGAAFRAGLELSGICIVAIAVILTVYYAGIRLLESLFPFKPDPPKPDAPRTDI